MIPSTPYEPTPSETNVNNCNVNRSRNVSSDSGSSDSQPLILSGESSGTSSPSIAATTSSKQSKNSKLASRSAFDLLDVGLAAFNSDKTNVNEEEDADKNKIVVVDYQRAYLRRGSSF